MSGLYAEAVADVPDHLKQKFLNKAAYYWDVFYNNHASKFFKDRHYFEREWPELTQPNCSVLEVGCGAGNTIYPLLEINPTVKVYACDFAPQAVQLVQNHPEYASGRVHAFVADLTSTDLIQHVPPHTMDFVTMVFVLSAVAPGKMPGAVANLARTLRPGGHVLFRDYADGDLAQERRETAGARRISERFFVRGDGTCCYHFQPGELCALFASCGFTCTALTVHERDVENRKQGIVMRRRWIQASFQLISVPPPFPPPSGSLPDFPPTDITSTLQYLPASYLATMGTTDSQQTCAAGGGQATAEPVRGFGCTWLTGAAGRLASHAHEPPGVPSGRALLPETLDSADELASALSPGKPTGHQYSNYQPASGMPGEVGLQQGHVAAAMQHSNGQHHPSGRSSTAHRQLEQELEAEFFATVNRRTQDVVAEELALAGIAGITLSDPMHTDTAQHSTPTMASTAAVPLEVVPGLVFDIPAIVTGASTHADAHNELQLARLLVAVSNRLRGVSKLAAAMDGGSVVTVGTGPGAIAAMTMVRRCNIRRVLVTHYERPTLHNLATCIQANAARLVFERLKVAQLDSEQDSTGRNVLNQVSQAGGADVILVSNLHMICCDVPHLQYMFNLLRMAAYGQQLPANSVVRSLHGDDGTGNTGCDGSRRQGSPCAMMIHGACPEIVHEAARSCGWVFDASETQQVLQAGHGLTGSTMNVTVFVTEA